MARLSVKVLHDPGDPDGGVVIVQDGKEVQQSQGDSQEYVLGQGGLNIKLRAVDERGVPIGNRAEVRPEVGMSRTDPRGVVGGAGPGGQTAVDGTMRGPGGAEVKPAAEANPQPQNPPATQGPKPTSAGNA